MKESHRGIPTNTAPRNEIKLRTIRNRWKQLSLSLPRIDDAKRWAGYPGNTGISKKMALLIKPCTIYCEPFAGTCKIAQELMKLNPKPYKEIHLNDRAGPIAAWLKENFPQHTVTQKDFVSCVQDIDSKDTVFLFDPPWFRSYYDQIFSSFNRVNVAQYEDDLLELCGKIEGTFYITTRLESKRMQQATYRHLLIKSEYPVAGKTPQTLVTTNDDG